MFGNFLSRFIGPAVILGLAACADPPVEVGPASDPETTLLGGGLIPPTTLIDSSGTSAPQVANPSLAAPSQNGLLSLQPPDAKNPMLGDPATGSPEKPLYLAPSPKALPQKAIPQDIEDPIKDHNQIGIVFVKFGSVESSNNTCVGTLITQTLFLTSAHCLGLLNSAGAWTASPLLWRGRDAATLARTFSVTFPTQEIRKAVAVKFVADISYLGEEGHKYKNDMAILELKPSKIKYNIRPISHDGFKVGQEVTLVKSQPDPKKDNTKEIVADTCVTDRAIDLATGPQPRGFVLLKKCKIAKGNSGSIIIRNGKLAGMLFAKNDASKDKDIVPVGYALSFACVDFSNPTNPWKTNDPACSTDYKVATSERFSQISSPRIDQ